MYSNSFLLWMVSFNFWLINTVRLWCIVGFAERTGGDAAKLVFNEL